MSTLYNFKTLQDKVWVTSDGRRTPYNQLEGSHLLSIIEEVKRRKEQNVKRILNKVSTHTEEDTKFVQLLEALEQEKTDRINGWNVSVVHADESPTAYINGVVGTLTHILNKTPHKYVGDQNTDMSCPKCAIQLTIDTINNEVN